jgi:hypothetical protein
MNDAAQKPSDEFDAFKFRKRWSRLSRFNTDLLRRGGVFGSNSRLHGGSTDAV